MQNFLRYAKYQAACVAAGILIANSSLVFADPIELSLEKSIELALKNNPAIQIANTDREKSVWGVKEAEGGKLPSLSLGSNYRTNQDTKGSGDFNNSLSLNWQLYSGGRLENQVKQSELGVTNADLSVEKTKQQVKLDAISGYYDVLAARNLLAVNQETVDNLTTHLNNVQAQYDTGVVAKSDLLRSQVELANAQQNLIKAQNNYEVALSALFTTMNIKYDNDVTLDGDLQYESDNRTLEDCISAAMKNRPDIAQANVAVDIASSGVDSAKSGKLPTVSLSASTGWNNNILPDTDSWSVGVGASFNVFDGGITNNKIKGAESSLAKAKLQVQQTESSAEQEVRQSYLNMKEAEKRQESTKMTVGKANEDLYIAQEKYKAGMGTNLDVIDAQLALTQAQTNHVQALYDYNVNKAKLDKAIGYTN